MGSILMLQVWCVWSWRASLWPSNANSGSVGSPARMGSQKNVEQFQACPFLLVLAVRVHHNDNAHNISVVQISALKHCFDDVARMNSVKAVSFFFQLGLEISRRTMAVGLRRIDYSRYALGCDDPGDSASYSSYILSMTIEDTCVIATSDLMFALATTTP